jgi:hypothetical protein
MCVPESSFMVDTLFSLFFSVVGGFFLACAFTAHLIEYTAEDTDTDTDTTEESVEEETILEDKYYEELNALDVRLLTKEELDALRSKVVKVETPDGLVKMTYNNLSDSFWYYTDNKNIHYKYLDAVARHFTIENNCRQICVNYKEEYEKGLSNKNNVIEVKADKINNLLGAGAAGAAGAAPVKKSVFAKFKNYKVTTSGDDKTQTKNIYVLTDKANQFKFAGSMAEYALEMKQIRQQAVEIPSMDYATFKKLVMASVSTNTAKNLSEITDDNPMTTRL